MKHNYLPASSLSRYFASSRAPTSSLSISILVFLKARFSSSSTRHFSSRRFLSQSTRWIPDISLARRIWKKQTWSWSKHEAQLFFGVTLKARNPKPRGKHGGVLVHHLLQDLKAPGSNLIKDLTLIELEMMRDLWDSKLCDMWAAHYLSLSNDSTKK